MKFKVLARHRNWVVGATITELVSEDGALRRFVATIRGFRNWPILVCPSVDACSWMPLVQGHVISLRDRIDANDDSVFNQSPELGPHNLEAAKAHAIC